MNPTLARALRSNRRRDWRRAKREAASIGSFALAMVIGLEAHARREADRARIASGGYVVDIR